MFGPEPWPDAIEFGASVPQATYVDVGALLFVGATVWAMADGAVGLEFGAATDPHAAEMTAATPKNQIAAPMRTACHV